MSITQKYIKAEIHLVHHVLSSIYQSTISTIRDIKQEVLHFIGLFSVSIPLQLHAVASRHQQPQFHLVVVSWNSVLNWHVLKSKNPNLKIIKNILNGYTVVVNNGKQSSISSPF